MTDESGIVRMAVRVGTADTGSAVAINGRLVQTYDHAAATQGANPLRARRKTRYAKPEVFSGPKLKVERAKKHIADLQMMLDAFHQSNPYSLAADIDPQTGEQVFRINIEKAIPDEISVVVGDAVHNLRAALDYIICDLIRTNNARLPPDRQRDPARTEAGFKLHNGAKIFEAGTIGKIRGVSPRAERVVLRLKRHKGWARQAWLLHWLDIIDKHNLIVTVASATTQITSVVTVPFMFRNTSDGTVTLCIGGDCPTGHVPLQTLQGVPGTARNVFPVHHGGEFHRVAPHLDEKADVSLFVAFGQGEIVEGQPVLETVQQFADLVERTIRIFERVP